MTAEEVFNSLSAKYGEAFNWYLLPLSQSNGTLVDELKKELSKDHFLYHQEIWAVAKCAANDDVLYVTASDSGGSIYYIFHLTYSTQNLPGFPRCEKFADICAVKEYIERTFIKNHTE